MGNSFASLMGLGEELKAKAKAQEEADMQESQEKARIARETREFLSHMNRIGAKPKAGTSYVVGQKREVDFASVMLEAGVQPLKGNGKVTHGKSAPKAAKVAQPVYEEPSDAELLEGEMSDEADTMDFIESEDGKLFRREEVGSDVPRDLRRGRWPVMAQLDLHGMFVDEARMQVASFLTKSRMNGRLCVRIIHGKGYGSMATSGEAVLKKLVRRWLKQCEFVQAFVEPYEHLGGSGAVVVRLAPKS